MSTMTVILQLGLLLINIAFQQSYVWTQNLDCVNDYDKEMVCHLLPEEKKTCHEYKLRVEVSDEKYDCVFDSSECKCKFQVKDFFVDLENISATLLRNETLVLTKQFNTGNSIKPKRPTIVSVNLTANGNFLITWSTGYTNPTLKSYVDNLCTELIYGVEGSTANETKLVTASLTQYELVGRNLQPNSNYYVMARVSTDYNNNSRFSDYSKEYKFNTSSSLQNIFKIIIPISCVIVVISIATLYYCYSKIKSEWWNKIPAPKVDLRSEEHALPLKPFEDKYSPVYMKNSQLDPADNKWTLLPEVSRENSGHSFGEKGNSALPNYVMTGNGSVEEDNVDNNTLCELLDDYQSASSAQKSLYNKLSNNLQSNKANLDNHTECGNTSASSFSNRSYFASDSSGNNHIEESHPCPAFSKSPVPLIQTDFEYSPCNDCPGPANTSLTHFTPFSDDAAVVPGYQSVNEVMCRPDRTETDESGHQASISTHTDVNLILDKIMCSKNSLDVLLPPCKGISVDSGYQALQSLDQRSGEWDTKLEQNISQDVDDTINYNKNCGERQVHTPALKSLCGPLLHISPGIQIDCSYQRV